MKEIFKKVTLTLVTTSMVLGTVLMPKVVKAEEPDDGGYYPVDITDGNEHAIDISAIDNDTYERWVELKLDAPVETIEHQSYFNGGFYRTVVMEPRADDATEVHPTYKDNVDYEKTEEGTVIGNVTAQFTNGNIVIKTDYTGGIIDNVLVLDEGESITLYGSDIRSAKGVYVLAHKGAPTHEEKLSVLAIRSDGSYIEEKTANYNSYDYWRENYHEYLVKYDGPTINGEPFVLSNTFIDSDGDIVDSWWGQSRPATKVTAKYTREGGFELVYEWTALPATPAPVIKEIPEEVKNVQKVIAGADDYEAVTGLKGEDSPAVQAVAKQIGGVAMEKLYSVIADNKEVTIAGVKVSSEMLRTNEYAQKMYIMQVVTDLGLVDRIAFCDGSTIGYINADGTISIISLF